MAKVLITGATGFIGPHLAKHLRDAGDHVICLRRATSRVDRLEPLGVEFVSGDITAEDSLHSALAEVDVVYHLAGVVKALRRSEFQRVNVDGARNLLAAAAGVESPPVVVLVSSLAAAGPAPPDRPLNESDQGNPVSVYGHSKRQGELAAMEFADRVPLSIVRPPIVFGEQDRDVFEMFKPIARHGMHAVAGKGTGKFSLIHAADLASALRKVATDGERMPASTAEQRANPGAGWYYAAHDDHPTYVELGHLIGRALGREKVRVLRTPLPLAWLAASASELVARIRRRQGIFNLDKIREARAARWSCSATKIQKQLSWQAKATLAERLRQTALWYYAQGWLKRPKNASADSTVAEADDAIDPQ